MSLISDVLASIPVAVVQGLASARLLPWLQQRHPELRMEPLPDAARDMREARAVALLRDSTVRALDAAVARGDLSPRVRGEVLSDITQGVES